MHVHVSKNMCVYHTCMHVQTRLAIMIEDPREVERRRQLGIEADIGCSREDLGEALAEVRISVTHSVSDFEVDFEVDFDFDF